MTGLAPNHKFKLAIQSQTSNVDRKFRAKPQIQIGHPLPNHALYCCIAVVTNLTSNSNSPSTTGLSSLSSTTKSLHHETLNFYHKTLAFHCEILAPRNSSTTNAKQTNSNNRGHVYTWINVRVFRRACDCLGLMNE